MAKLWTDNIPGNLHQAASVINEWKLADNVIVMDLVGNYTITVFRVPDDFDINTHLKTIARGKK